MKLRTSSPSVFSEMFSQEQVNPSWQAASPDMPPGMAYQQHPSLPRTEPISPYLALPQAPVTPNPLADARYCPQGPPPQYSTLGFHRMQPPAQMLPGGPAATRRCATQTSPAPMMIAGTQTTPRPLMTQGPMLPIDIRQDLPSDRPAPVRPSCLFAGRDPASLNDKVCERCGCDRTLSRGQYLVVRMRREAAKIALRRLTSGATSAPPGAPAVGVAMATRRDPLLPLPMASAPLPGPSFQPSVANLQFAPWRPWMEPALDMRTVQARAQEALRNADIMRMRRQNATVTLNNSTTWKTDA